tara:strand:- start:1266 stop:2921 length:1656 start_codon:yes stop_codon:yes gene_type:complete
MSNIRIKDLSTEATSLGTDDFIPVDGNTSGTRKISKENLGTTLEIPEVGSQPNQTPLNLHLGSLAYADADSVAMGTVSISDKIDGSVEIADEDNCTLTLRSDSDNDSASRNTQIQFQIDAGTTKGLVSYDQDADVMQLSYGGNNKHLVVDSSGNTGFGQPSPSTKVDVNGVLTIDTDYAPSSAVGGLALGDYQGGGYKWVQSMNSQPLVLNPLGNNVGIGTTSPNVLLHCDSGGNSAANLKLEANRTGADTAIGQIISDWDGTTVAKIALKTGSDTTNKDDGAIVFETATAGSTAERVRIDSSGRIGQAGITPGSYHSSADNLVIANDGLGGDSGLTIRSGTSGEGAIYFADGTSGNARYRSYIVCQHSNDNLVFGTAGSNRWTINSSGNLVANSTGIDFGSVAEGSGTPVANGGLLDDYESGSLTATLTPSGSGTITVDSSTNTLRYVKVGNLVSVTGKIAVSAVSSPVGSYVYLNLPFTVGSATGNRTAGTVLISAAASNVNTYGVFVPNAGSTAYICSTDGTSLGAGTTGQDFSGNEELHINITYLSA